MYRKESIYEVVSIAIVFFVIFLYVNDFVGDGYKYAALFSIPSALLIATIFTNKGCVSRLLSLKPLTFLGDLSAYMFLIHFVVIKYSYAFLQKIFGVDFNKSVIVFVAFILTICAAIMWKWLIKRIKNWKPLV